MSGFEEAAQTRPAGEPDFQDVGDILGGPSVLKSTLETPIDAHELLLKGLPGAAVTHLVNSLAILRDPESLEKAFGISLRTLQRRRGDPTKRLNQEQSSRTWKFAEILARATAVLGSRTEAEQWLARPAIGLNQRRPIDLLTTAAGIDIVETYLTRIRYGVYT